MVTNSAFSTSLTLWMVGITRLSRAKVFIPEEEAGRISLATASNTHRSALTRFWVPKSILEGRKAEDGTLSYSVMSCGVWGIGLGLKGGLNKVNRRSPLPLHCSR